MATAYAALASLMNTIAMERTPHPPHSPIPPIPFDEALIDALLERVEFLVECLERGWKIPQGLEVRIADLAYAAEDAIESPIVHQILARSTGSPNERRSVLPDQDLETIIGGMDSIKTKIMPIQVTTGMKDLHLESQNTVASPSSAPRLERTTMVGLEDDKIQIMEKLVGQQSSREVIPIVGMGGIGKTTLAQNIYDDKVIVERFDVRAWVTISQEYDVENILKQIFDNLNLSKADTSNHKNFGDKVYHTLCGRRYLIILDDIWDIDVWIKIQRFFPDNENGSRVMVTTRLLKVADDLSKDSIHQMKYLDDDNSWDLLCEKVFGKEDCPTNLENIGKKIAKHCGGLPLAITVIGGLLAQSKTLEHWQHIIENFSSSIYLNDEDKCLNIVSLSYNHLPVHLKPCFLYLGAFPEDYKIEVSLVTNLWIAEGFLKSLNSGETCEEIAKQYLNDLIERNLIMIQEWTKFSKKIKYCTIHDVLRELCLREAQKENFLYVVSARNLAILGSMTCPRRIVIQLTKAQWIQHPQIIDSLKLIKSYPRSLIVYEGHLLLELFKFPNFWLLRVLLEGIESELSRVSSLRHVFPNLVNLRNINLGQNLESVRHDGISSCMGLFRNLQMLVTNFVFERFDRPSRFEIWNLPQLRHIEYHEFTLSEPPSSNQQEHDCIILKNLQALLFLKNFRFCDEVTKRIPNVKEIRVRYDRKEWKKRHYCAYNLSSLQRLERFECKFEVPGRLYKRCLLQNLAFPHSLKDLSLSQCELPPEDMSVIGSLPNLEVLKLHDIIIIGSTWEPIEGEFPRLKVLYMWMMGLKNWNADSSHFPQLEQLIIKDMGRFKEIPLDFGYISTLQLIKLIYCPHSVSISAKKILEEQESLGNEGLVVEVYTKGDQGEDFHGYIYSDFDEYELLDSDEDLDSD